MYIGGSTKLSEKIVLNNGGPLSELQIILGWSAKRTYEQTDKIMDE